MYQITPISVKFLTKCAPGQAECMLQNISENLKKGGFFIGTTPDSNDIMSRLQA